MAEDKISRQSAELLIEIDKGSTFRHTITWKSGPEGSETPVDLTGCSAEMQIREDQDSDIILHTLSTGIEGGITLGDAAGTIELYIADGASTAFDWNSGVYGLEITFSNGDVRRLLRGKIKAFNETTR